MEQTKEQKSLKLFSVVELVFAVGYVLLAILMFVGDGAAIGNSSQIAAEGVATAEEATTVGSVFIGGGIGYLIAAVLCLVFWYYLRKVANDAKAYKGAYVLAILNTVFAAIGVVSVLLSGKGGNVLSSVVSLLISVYILVLVNKIKQSVNA